MERYRVKVDPAHWRGERCASPLTSDLIGPQVSSEPLLLPQGRQTTTETTRLRTTKFPRRSAPSDLALLPPSGTSRDLANLQTPDGTRWRARKFHKDRGSNHSEAVTDSHEANRQRICSYLGPLASAGVFGIAREGLDLDMETRLAGGQIMHTGWYDCAARYEKPMAPI